MSLATAPKDRGTVLAEERTDLAVERTRIAAEKNANGMDTNCPFDDWIRVCPLQVLQYLPEEIASGNIRNPQAPPQSGANPYFRGHSRISGRSLAAPIRLRRTPSFFALH